MRQINFSGITEEQERKLKELKGNGTWRDLADAIITGAREAEVVTRSLETREAVAKLDCAIAHVREIALGEFAAAQDRLDRLADKAEAERDRLELSLSETRAELAEVKESLADATVKASRVDELEARVAKAEEERDAALATAAKVGVDLTAAELEEAAERVPGFIGAMDGDGRLVARGDGLEAER